MQWALTRLALQAAWRIWDGFGGILGRVYPVLGSQNGEQIEIFGMSVANNNFNGDVVKTIFLSIGGPA